MKRTTFGIAALFLLSATPCVANAFTAIAWSQSGQKGGSVKNAPTKEAAISAAIADCKKSGGGSDCQVFKVTDEPGFVALYATCAKTCGVTAVTGRATAEQARADGKRECENHYRSACQLASEWQELKNGEILSVSKQMATVGDNGSIQNKKMSQVDISKLLRKHETQLKNQVKTQYIDNEIVSKIAFLIKSGQINFRSMPDNERDILMNISSGLEPIWESIWSTSGMYLNCKEKIKKAIAEWPASIENEYKKLISMRMNADDALTMTGPNVDLKNADIILECSN